MKYELFPDGRSELAAHIVVTSYEAPVDDSSRAFFKNTKWAGLIVDEGQRLKNDKNLLYGALTALKIPFRVLLTGKISIMILSGFTNTHQERLSRTTKGSSLRCFSSSTRTSMLLIWTSNTQN